MMKIKKYKNKRLLKNLKNVSSSIVNNEDVSKGTVDDPYSEDEFLELLDNDEWHGGYVIGYGYVSATVVINGACSSESEGYSIGDFSFPYGSGSSYTWPEDLFSSNPTEGNFSSDSNNGSGNDSSITINPRYNTYPNITYLVKSFNMNYDLFPGLGITSSYSYSYSLTVKNNEMTVYAEVLYPQTDIVYWGRVELYINGVIYNSYALQALAGVNYIQENHAAIGKTSFMLPNYGRLQVVLVLGIQAGNLSGHYMSHDNITIYTY